MGYGPVDGHFTFECEQENEIGKHGIREQYYDCHVTVYDKSKHEEEEFDIEMAGIESLGIKSEIDGLNIQSTTKQSLDPDLYVEIEGECSLQDIERRNKMSCR